jgi:1-acyl-sn-glycerol-3-phosphate acyltransferase
MVPTEAELEAPPSLAERLSCMARFGAVVAAAVPTTTVPPMALTALFYRRFKDEERFHRWHKMSAWASFCTRHVMQADVRVIGGERIPPERRGLLCVSNHQSYVDIPVIMGALPFRAFLSKSLVAYIPVIGQIAWLGGTIYFDRHRPEGRKKAQDDLLRMCSDSTPVVLFPEGTRSRDGRLREKVHLGAIRAAWEKGLRICPFALHGSRYVFPPTMDRMYPHQRVAIVVGEPLVPRDFPDGDTYALAAWGEVSRRFEEARELRRSPAWESLPRP